MDYPHKDFLDDFAAWKTSYLHLPGTARAKLLFSIRYPRKKVFSYRFNRFVCIMHSIHNDLPALIQDRVALSDGGDKGGGLIPDGLIIAMLEWYCSLSEEQMEAMPDPDWVVILDIYDRNSN
jgi:hypothetical protein